MTEPKIAIGTFTHLVTSATKRVFAGLLVSGQVHPIGPILANQPFFDIANPSVLDILDQWPSCWPILERAAQKLMEKPDTNGFSLDTLIAQAPISPRQVVCAGANYRKHVIDIMADHEGSSNLSMDAQARRERAEILMDHRAAHGQPFAFLKPVSAILDPFGDFEIPADSDQTDWELELAAVIGRPTYRVREEDALNHVAGYTITNDITARDHIARLDFPSLGLDFVAGKGGPGFLPLGPYIVPSELIDDPQKLMLTLTLNGVKMQHESSADMIFSVARLIEHVSTHIRLLPGDILCTGSPSGNGTHYNRFLRPGDLMEGHIDGLGMQRNHCVAEQVSPSAAMHKAFLPVPEANQ